MNEYSEFSTSIDTLRNLSNHAASGVCPLCFESIERHTCGVQWQTDTRADAERYAKLTYRCPHCLGRRRVSILEIGCDKLSCHVCDFECDREQESQIEQDRRRAPYWGPIKGQELTYTAPESKSDLDPLRYLWLVVGVALLVAGIMWSCR